MQHIRTVESLAEVAAGEVVEYRGIPSLACLPYGFSWVGSVPVRVGPMGLLMGAIPLILRGEGT
jgi:hypothetical protein